MTTTPNHLLGTDGLPCEGCEGSSGQAPITALGFCPACRDAAFRDYPSRALELVGPNIAIAACAPCVAFSTDLDPHAAAGMIVVPDADCTLCADADDA